MNQSSLGALYRPKINAQPIAGEHQRPCLPEPSGPPVVPPDHPMADFYRSGSGAARTTYRDGQKELQDDEERVEGAIVSTLALLDMAITAASMAGAGADDFE